MMETPEEFELIGFFESEPVESDPQDGFYVYEFADKNSVNLVFSFNDVESSVQARLLVNGNDIALFSQEGARNLRIEDDASGNYLRCSFNGSSADAQIRLFPYISVKWVALN